METFPLCTIPGFEEHSVELQFYGEETELKQLGHHTGTMDWRKARPTIKMKFDPCRSCRFDLLCEGPWMEYGRAFGGSEFLPVRGSLIESITAFRSLVDERMAAHHGK